MSLQSSSATAAVRQARVEQKRQLEGNPVGPPALVSYRDAEGKNQPQKISALARGKKIEVAQGELVRLRFPGGAQAILPPGALVKIPEDSFPVAALFVEKGLVRFLVSHLNGIISPRKPIRFLAITPHGVVGARGTDFSVEVFETRTVARVSIGKIWIAQNPDDFVNPRVHREIISPSVVDLELGRADLPKPRDFDWFPWTQDFEKLHPGIPEEVKKVLEEQKELSSHSKFAPRAKKEYRVGKKPAKQ